MNKLGIGLWCAAIMGAFTLLYMVRYQAQNTQEEIASIEQRILEEKEAMHVLKAEWSYLTRPERLKQLTHQLQEMEPVTQQKVIRLTDIPLQDSGAEAAAETAAAQPGSPMPNEAMPNPAMPAPTVIEPQNIPQMVTLPAPAAPRVERVSATSAAPLRVTPLAVVPMEPVPPPQIQPPPVRRAVASAASVVRMQPKHIKAVVVQPTATVTEPLPSWDVLVPEETAEGTR